jgi:hypothetical protein
MKRFVMEFVVVLVFSLLFTGETKTFAQPAVTTPVCSSITVDTTFTLAGSPYEICDTAGLKVQQGATLTIQPGVTVMFDGTGYQFTVEGTLNSLGTAAQPVIITGKTASAGSWRGLQIAGTGGVKAMLNMDYTTVQYGGGFATAEIYADLADVTINHSQIQSSLKNGLELTNNASFTVQNTSFTNNVQDAMTIHEPKVDMALTGLTASENGQNAVHIAGLNTQMHGPRDWSNPGLPYFIDGSVNNSPGDVLTIDSGNELHFNGGALNIGGELLAQGSQTRPILLTGLNPAAGSWVGLSADGGTSQAFVQLDYVTVEFGGGAVGGADVNIVNGQLVAHHSIFRSSAKDGVRINSNAMGSVLDGQIYGNALYGVRNTVSARGVLATNNWWGDAGGPISDVVACPSGLGDKVTAGVFYLPIVAASNTTSLFPLSAMPSITLTPRRWFTPADGVTRDYFDITLTDGNGAPIPGRTVKLSVSPLVSVTDGGITDANGKALAWLTSNGVTGDVQVTASLDATTGCEGVISPAATVTFTTPINITDLLPNAPASYFDGDIKVSPLPVTVGVPETISVNLTNPLSTPITVDVEFGYAQSGIGLAFGTIKTITGLNLPGNTTVPVSAIAIPPITGHYCVQVSYTITAVGGVPAIGPQAQPQLKWFNWNPEPSRTAPPPKSDELIKTENSLKLMNKYIDRAYDSSLVLPLAVANRGITWDLNNAKQISHSLQGDPPRQDFTLISQPVKLKLPPEQAGGGISVARAAALNDLDNALAEVNADGTAAQIALDRYGGASAAGNLTWASTQNGVMQEYERQMGVALVDAAAKIDALLNVAISEGQTSQMVTVDDVIAMQTRLQGGFSTQEIADAHAIGLMDADIESIRQEILAANPADMAGDTFVAMRAIRDQFISLGLTLQNPNTFYPSFSVTGGAGDAGLQPQATGNTMAQVYNSVISFPVGNPGASAATITLKVRRIDLPADWTVNVTPSQVMLDPGAQTTVTLTVGAGSPTRWGTIPRVAVEAYDGTTLLGGVTFDIVVPYYAPFDGKLHVFLPAVRH